MIRTLLSAIVLFDGRHTLPGFYDVLIEDGVIVRVAPSDGVVINGAERIAGGALLPGPVDAHVHLTFSTPDSLLNAGITAALDLGAPLTHAFSPTAPLRVRWAGPLLTASGGYPTRSWGAGGYGHEIRDEQHARESVALMQDRGASMIKIAAEGKPVLSASVIRAIVDEAHKRGLRTIAHALKVPAVRVACESGVDALAHTPVEALPDDLIGMLAARGVAVVSTVRAFGGSRETSNNLLKLAQAGCTVAYGTDLGNAGILPGVDAKELEHVGKALGSADAALAAMTTTAAELAGFPVARIAEGERATLVAATSLEFAALRTPVAMWIEGVRVI
ncbi:MAG: amidohydrolase family protein [Actinomycetota bacterium]